MEIGRLNVGFREDGDGEVYYCSVGGVRGWVLKSSVITIWNMDTHVVGFMFWITCKRT